ncbi:MAG TPA: DUF2277 domain-containing protein [Acidimicrobiales bacterium]
MCRNITILRGLEPAATRTEIEAAARQYVRKVGGLRTTSRHTEDAFERAARKVADATAELLAALPPRQQPPRSDPPLRRLKARDVVPSA